MRYLCAARVRFLWTCCLLLSVWSCQSGPGDAEENPLYDLSGLSREQIAKGEKLFKVSCARCHGMYANGGNAPSLRRLQLIHAPNNEALFNVIQFGIPGTEMPGTWLLSPPDIKLIAAYIRSIGLAKAEKIPGDPSKGLAVYEQKGGCVACHMIQGKGGSLGPDLSQVGLRRPASYIRRTLLEPGFDKEEAGMPKSASGFTENLIFSLTTLEGEQLMGMRVNEDAFSIQLRDAANQYHSFQKSALKSLKKEYGKSLMPSMKGVLNEQELNDLIAYLVNLK